MKKVNKLFGMKFYMCKKALTGVANLFLAIPRKIAFPINSAANRRDYGCTPLYFSG